MGLSVAPPVPAPAGPAVERPAGGPEGRVLPARVVLAVALLLLGVLVAALAVGGGSPRPATDGLPDAGPVTGWGLPVVGMLGRLLAVVTVGLLVHAALLVPAPGGRLPVPARRSSVLVTTTATLWLAAEAVGALLTASSLYAVPVTSLTASGVAAALTQLDPGRASLAVVVLLAPVVLGAAVARRARTARALLVLALGAVVVPVVLAGHSAAAADHTATVVALSVHVVTASLWVGGLLALLLQRSGAASTPPVVRRFSTLALVCVALLAGSGVLSALLVLGGPRPGLLDSGYVRLLLVKTVLLVVLAGAGWWHRRRTLPALDLGAPGAFVRLAVAEVLLMVVVVTVSVALATSPPPARADESVAASAAAAPAAGAPAELADPAPVDPADPAPVDSADPAPVDPAPAVAEDMSGHDHGDLSVSVLVDEERFHVSGTVRPGQRVTVYNSGPEQVSLTATDGSFDAVAGPRSFITFEAPAGPGDYLFASTLAGRGEDILLVRSHTP